MLKNNTLFGLLGHTVKLGAFVAVFVANPDDVLAQFRSASGSYDCEATWIGGEAEYCASIGNLSGLRRIADLGGISNGLKIYTAEEVKRLEAGISAADVLVSANDMEGHLRVAYAYANGDVRPDNAALAIYHYEHAAKLGSIEAMTSLGFIYQKGHPRLGGRDKAQLYLRQAALAGSSFARRQFEDFDHFWELYHREYSPDFLLDSLTDSIAEGIVDSPNIIDELSNFHDRAEQIVPILINAFPYSNSFSKVSIARTILNHEYLSPGDAHRLAEYTIQIEVEEHEDSINRIYEEGYLRSVMIDAIGS
ncbi:MAG: hypothetical protein AAFV54_14750, partial [Pseudomonadota bacterium]